MTAHSTPDRAASTGAQAAPSDDPQQALHARYSAAAEVREAALCCPVDYDPQYLKAIPDEVLARDYGCGDPSRYVEAGDTVLDLGSGGGKICFIASQVAGPKGHVIGVDMNDAMLDLARRAEREVADKLGYANVEFKRGEIQDLALDGDRLAHYLSDHPVADLAGLALLESEKARLRTDDPMIRDESIDIVVSNCVLNLVRDADKSQLIEEIFRVLKVGGRVALSDIVSDEIVPQSLRDDPDLWSGCISGAFHELDLLKQMEAAGFHGISMDTWEHEPFAVVDGIEFRSVTVTAHKGKQGPCLEANQAVIYAGPWKRVEDDDGHVFERGERVAVCAKTHRLLTQAPYNQQIIGIDPKVTIPESERDLFTCAGTRLRSPRESKGEDYRETRGNDGSGCC